jgi:hypothetical protein
MHPDQVQRAAALLTKLKAIQEKIDTGFQFEPAIRFVRGQQGFEVAAKLRTMIAQGHRREVLAELEQLGVHQPRGDEPQAQGCDAKMSESTFISPLEFFGQLRQG